MVRRRIDNRLRRLEKRPRREIDEESKERLAVALKRMCETQEGREALEQLERMLAEAEPIPADDPVRPGAEVRAAMRVDSERYIEVVSRFNGYFFSAQEEIKAEPGDS
jgi:hypothetical protein